MLLLSANTPETRSGCMFMTSKIIVLWIQKLSREVEIDSFGKQSKKASKITTEIPRSVLNTSFFVTKNSKGKVQVQHLI